MATTLFVILAVVVPELSVAKLSSVAVQADKSLARPSLDALALRTNVSEYGITWTFAVPAHVGQFVNGDYYVVGPVTIVQIDPKPLWGDEVGQIIDKGQVHESRYPGKQARNGSELDPTAFKLQGGFDSRIPDGRYDPNLFAHLPIRMKPGDSLVSTISRPNDQITRFGAQNVDPLKVCAVLTCLGEPQPPDAFRPSYCDCAHSKIYLARNLRRNLLLNLRRPPLAPASLEKYANDFKKPWLDVVEFGFAAPVENLPHYGQELAQLDGEASLLLLMNYPAKEKEPLLINFVQVGIDLWGVARAGGTWPAHGGLNSGRKWPIIFAGIMLGDPDMQSPTKNLPHLHFGEDDQTAMCPYTYKGKIYTHGWTGAKAIFTGHSLLGAGGLRGVWALGRGPVDLFPPSQWPHIHGTDLPESEGYRRSNTSAGWVAEALAARLMHAEPVWNHDAFFAYVDRWMTEDDMPYLVQIKEAGFQDLTKIPYGRFMRQGFVSGARFVAQAWRMYRDHIPPGPDGKPTPSAETTWK